MKDYLSMAWDFGKRVMVGGLAAVVMANCASAPRVSEPVQSPEPEVRVEYAKDTFLEAAKRKLETGAVTVAWGKAMTPYAYEILERVTETTMGDRRVEFHGEGTIHCKFNPLYAVADMGFPDWFLRVADRVDMDGDGIISNTDAESFEWGYCRLFGALGDKWNRRAYEKVCDADEDLLACARRIEK